LNSTAGVTNTILIKVAVYTAERQTCCLDMHTRSPNGGGGAVSGDGEFIILGLPVFVWRLNTSFDI